MHVTALQASVQGRSNGFFTSSQSQFSLRPDSENDESAIKDKHDSPEQKKGVVTDPDIAPPKKSSPKQQTPSSKKTNELVSQLGVPHTDHSSRAFTYFHTVAHIEDKTGPEHSYKLSYFRLLRGLLPNQVLPANQIKSTDGINAVTSRLDFVPCRRKAQVHQQGTTM